MSTKLTNHSSINNLRLLFLVISIALFVITLIIILQNWQTAPLKAFTATYQIPLAMIDILCLLVGSGLGYSIRFLLDRKALNNDRKLQWQAQDVKLAASIVSDKEKQLEAKIATLEAALKSALKKQV